MTPDVTAGAEPRYRLDARIATGGMGEVWRATDTVLGREVAVKVLKHEYSGDPSFRARFQAEARHAASLHHPGVASVFDVGELTDGDAGDGAPRPYIVMELVPGEPLSTLLRDGEPMPPATASDLVGQAADALAAAHARRLVHRDVKPGNLLVTPEGRVKITDFGIARAADVAGVTSTGQVLGTPAYLAPEQAEGKEATAASDVYALGVVLYECLAGVRPFVRDTPVGTALAHVRDTPPPLPDTVPDHLRHAVTVALAKDPAGRFPSMAAFADALRGGPVPSAAGAGAGAVGSSATPIDAGQTRVLETVPPPAPPPEHERRSRRPGWLPWAGAAAAVLAIVLLVSLLSGSGDDAPPSSDPTSAETSDPVEPTPTEEPAQPTPTEEEVAGVEVLAEDYRGLTKDEAKTKLEGLGLKHKEQQVDNDGSVAEGTVLDLAPTGTLEEGAEVTLVVAGPAPAPDDADDTGDDGDDEEDDGNGPPGKSNGKGPKKDKD